MPCVSPELSVTARQDLAPASDSAVTDPKRRPCLRRARIRERRSSVAVLLCGTSGTGKSTLASLLAARLGITTLLSTVGN